MLSVIPYWVTGLTELGIALFIINIILYVSFLCIIITRFGIHRGTFKQSLANPHEGLFLAIMVLSISTIITNTTLYGLPNTGPWLITALRIAFWIYVAISTILTIGYYYMLFTIHTLDINNVLPGWVLHVFHTMLVGTLASPVCRTQPPEAAAMMLVAGLSYKLFGLFISFMMYALYFGRLLTQGLPADVSRSAMFIAVGPPAFTALALLGMSQDVVITGILNDPKRGLAGFSFEIQAELLPPIIQLLALLAAIGLWMLALFFFAIVTFAALEMAPRENPFRLNWYAYVFPNVGFVIATIKIGERLGNETIQIVGSLMGAALVVLWAFIVARLIKAVIHHEICWPGKDEDFH